MSINRNEFIKLLQSRFPNVDIRSDQTELIRLHTSKLSAGCAVRNGIFTATIVSNEASELDYSDELVAKLSEEDIKLFLDKLSTYFK
jgi:hypothetical protein